MAILHCTRSFKHPYTDTFFSFPTRRNYGLLLYQLNYSSFFLTNHLSPLSIRLPTMPQTSTRWCRAQAQSVVALRRDANYRNQNLFSKAKDVYKCEESLTRRKQNINSWDFSCSSGSLIKWLLTFRFKLYFKTI